MPFGGLLTVGILGLVGGVGSAVIGSSAASNAAQTQSDAAIQAAQIQAAQANKALDFQKQVYGTQQQQFAPWLSSGTSALANLSYLLGISPGGTAGAPGQSGTNMVSGPGLGIPRPGAPVQTGAGDLATLGPAGMPTGATPTAAPGGPPRPIANSNIQAPIRGETGQGAGVLPNRTAGTPGRAPAAAPGGPYTPPSNLNSLVNPNIGGFGSLSQGWNQQFQAPTNVTEQNDPGFQFRLQQGENALQNSAAARGGLLTGGTARDLSQFGQDYASNEYGNVYNRAFNEYATRYNQFEQGQANQFNRLASLAGVGQTAAGQLGTLGQSAAGNIGNILLTSGAQQGQQLNNSAAATASGYIGSANAYGGALGNLGNLGQLLSLSSLLNKGGGGDQFPSIASWGG